MRKQRLVSLVLAAVMIFGINGCSVYKAFSNIARLQFKLGNIQDLLLSGIQVSNKSRLTDFSATDVLRLTSAVTSKQLPVTFTLYVHARNPNDGTGGYPSADVSLKAFPWKLIIDNKETITGNISQPVVVPGVGEEIRFPLQVNFDLFQFFADRGYEGLVNLALRLGGQASDPVDVKLVAQPTIGSQYGDFQYPKEMTIIRTQFQ